MKTREQLIKEYPHLIAINEGSYIDPVIAAQNIRIELGRSFPGLKFRVKTKKYSGGNSIDINWEDGATEPEVKEIVGKYQEGHFNGMIAI